jgi:hypothetical protein
VIAAAQYRSVAEIDKIAGFAVIMRPAPAVRGAMQCAP